jgi:hypothetical protein
MCCGRGMELRDDAPLLLVEWSIPRHDGDTVLSVEHVDVGGARHDDVERTRGRGSRTVVKVLMYSRLNLFALWTGVLCDV